MCFTKKGHFCNITRRSNKNFKKTIGYKVDQYIIHNGTIRVLGDIIRPLNMEKFLIWDCSILKTDHL